MLTSMPHTAFQEKLGHNGESETRDRFNVVVLYDRAEAARRAVNQLRQVTDPLAEDLDLQVRLWRLDVVMDAANAKTIAQDLATAELLVVALDQEGFLAADDRDRLEAAIQQMRAQGAAMAILPGENSATTPSRFKFLTQTAKEAGIGILYPPVGHPPAGTDCTFGSIHHRATIKSPLLERLLNDPHPQPRLEEKDLSQ